MTENKEKDKEDDKDKDKESERPLGKDEQIGTQRVYKKTSSNSVLTLYLPTRELISCGGLPAILKGIVFVDPKAIQGCRVYAQLTLTFRYGREDEEVMGLRFCNEAIMSLHQVWPRNEEPNREPLTPLQDTLLRRLGEGAHPFTLSVPPQAPSSVQLVPAKRYYGAPIGTSYDIRCFIADKTEEKFVRRATVRMGVRVIHQTDVFSSTIGPENFTTLSSSPVTAPPQNERQIPSSAPGNLINPTSPNQLNVDIPMDTSTTHNTGNSLPSNMDGTSSAQQYQHMSNRKSRKSERGDSFPRIRLSPKTFRFSSRFIRSKSEAERASNECYFNYSRSFQEYDTCGGPQVSVDKPFLLQDGRVGLRASLDKSWYTHGEDVVVTINIKNDSKKTVRRMRVCAIQHVDVCMFNNGKFKNVVADTDFNSPSGTDKIVGPGGIFNTTVTLKPQRGPTKNWIALEDSLQRSNEPDEITGDIAASAIRSAPAVPLGCLDSPSPGTNSTNASTTGDDRNVFAIYVSYYVKVKLTLSGMGGELSLKLPFALVHVDSSAMKSQGKCEDQPNENKRSEITNAESRDVLESVNKLTLSAVDKRLSKRASSFGKSPTEINNLSPISGVMNIHQSNRNSGARSRNTIDKIETIEDDIPVILCRGENSIKTTAVDGEESNRVKRKLRRHETIVNNLSSEDEQEEKSVNENESKNRCNTDSNQEVPIKEQTVIKKGFECSSGNPPSSSLSQKSPTQQTTCVQVHATTS